MDGAHQSGRRASEKRGRPQGSRPVTAETPIEDLSPILTQAGQRKAKRDEKKARGAQDPEYGNRYPKDRRIVMVVRRRTGKKGKGANGTRVGIGMAETAPEVEGILSSFAGMAESKLNTDSSPAYAAVGKQFLVHRTVDHSLELSGPGGENNNQAEDYNWRFDRTEQGTYLNIEPKYMLDYGCEVAFRADTCRISTGNRLKLLLNLAMTVGRSQLWRGYTRGKHRTHELLHAGPRAARASGPAKGSRSGDRLPR
ncbi:MAG: transposase [Azonexus sp.]